jgi:predicted AAA+ superfamily ATPase
LITLFENKNKTFDIYITGSNANLLSSEFSTFLTGRHKDIMVYPIEYSELLSFFNFEKYDLLDKYLTYGGLGISIPYYESNKELKRILVDIFNDTIERDIKKRYNAKSNIHIDKVINFAYSTIGGIISTTNLEKFLKNDKKYSLTTKTIEKYLKWICNSQLLFKVNYFDVKGKRVLKTSGKYYAGDLGLLSCKIGFSSSINEGFRMENAVYLHLLNCGYEVYTFKNKNGHEIDFLTIDGENNFSFIQVTSLLSDENYERESRSLLELKNA